MEKETEQKVYEPLFSISTHGQLRNRTSQKLSVSRDLLEGFWWKSSCVLTLRYSFRWEYLKRENQNFKKSIFLKILSICTCKVEKIRKIFTPDFEVFSNWRWKYIKKWLIPLIFSNFYRAVLEKPVILDFVRFLNCPRDEIEKSGS